MAGAAVDDAFLEYSIGNTFCPTLRTNHYVPEAGRKSKLARDTVDAGDLVVVKGVCPDNSFVRTPSVGQPAQRRSIPSRSEYRRAGTTEDLTSTARFRWRATQDG